MITTAAVLGALKDVGLVAAITVCVFLARYDMPRRAIQALSRRIRGEFAPACPADSAGAGHPVTRRRCTAPGLPVDGEPLSDEEWIAFTALALAASARVPQQGETS